MNCASCYSPFVIYSQDIFQPPGSLEDTQHISLVCGAEKFSANYGTLKLWGSFKEHCITHFGIHDTIEIECCNPDVLEKLLKHFNPKEESAESLQAVFTSLEDFIQALSFAGYFEIPTLQHFVKMKLRDPQFLKFLNAEEILGFLRKTNDSYSQIVFIEILFQKSLAEKHLKHFQDALHVLFERDLSQRGEGQPLEWLQSESLIQWTYLLSLEIHYIPIIFEALFSLDGLQGHSSAYDKAFSYGCRVLQEYADCIYVPGESAAIRLNSGADVRRREVERAFKRARPTVTESPEMQTIITPLSADVPSSRSTDFLPFFTAVLSLCQAVRSSEQVFQLFQFVFVKEVLRGAHLSESEKEQIRYFKTLGQEAPNTKESLCLNFILQNTIHTLLKRNFNETELLSVIEEWRERLFDLEGVNTSAAFNGLLETIRLFLENLFCDPLETCESLEEFFKILKLVISIKNAHQDWVISRGQFGDSLNEFKNSLWKQFWISPSLKACSDSELEEKLTLFKKDLPIEDHYFCEPLEAVMRLSHHSAYFEGYSQVLRKIKLLLEGKKFSKALLRYREFESKHADFKKYSPIIVDLRWQERVEAKSLKKFIKHFGLRRRSVFLQDYRCKAAIIGRFKKEQDVMHRFRGILGELRGYTDIRQLRSLTSLQHEIKNALIEMSAECIPSIEVNDETLGCVVAFLENFSFISTNHTLLKVVDYFESFFLANLDNLNLSTSLLVEFYFKLLALHITEGNVSKVKKLLLIRGDNGSIDFTYDLINVLGKRLWNVANASQLECIFEIKDFFESSAKGQLEESARPKVIYIKAWFCQMILNQKDYERTLQLSREFDVSSSCDSVVSPMLTRALALYQIKQESLKESVSKATVTEICAAHGNFEALAWGGFRRFLNDEEANQSLGKENSLYRRQKFLRKFLCHTTRRPLLQCQLPEAIQYSSLLVANLKNFPQENSVPDGPEKSKGDD